MDNDGGRTTCAWISIYAVSLLAVGLIFTPLAPFGIVLIFVACIAVYRLINEEAPK